MPAFPLGLPCRTASLANRDESRNEWSLIALLATLVSACLTPAPCAGEEPRSPTAKFNREIRPILAETCFTCHGPDAGKRKADLRLDTRAGALEDHQGTAAIVPGDTAKSELIRRITSADEAERMPPTESGKRLTASQIESLTRWIAEGAEWQDHWSFLSPTPPDLPAFEEGAPAAGWARRNPIDAFVHVRLVSEGLAPAPEADRATLLRRASFDLTGLPPTPEEIDAFIADPSPQAFDKELDRLLASPRYGERMAARWLDGARYADTNGYQSDGERDMWRWRDWVIDAYNRNLPFDRFTIEQLAGDLLPGATIEQRIATGFNRNHRGNGEGGIIPEEYAVEYVVDRVDTTSTVWLGLTLGCARCHDHKFDPLSQRDFYGMYAFFDNIPERGRAIKFGNSPPMIKAPTAEDQRRLAQVEARVQAAETAFALLGPKLAEAQAAWEKSARVEPALDWTIPEGLLARADFEGPFSRVEPTPSPPPATAAESHTPNSAADAKRDPLVCSSVGEAPNTVAGPSGQAGEFDGKTYLQAENVGDFDYLDKFTLTAWVKRAEGQGGTIVSRMTDVDQGDGWRFGLDDGKPGLQLVKRWLDDALRVEADFTLPPGEWRHLSVTYDGSRVAAGIKFFVDGQPVGLVTRLDDLNQTFKTKEPLRIAGGAGPQGRYSGALDNVLVYNRLLTDEEIETLSTPDSIAAILSLEPASRSSRQARKLTSYFLENGAPEEFRLAWREVTEARGERTRLEESFPTVMVMEERPQPRETRVLTRGEYDKPGERVERASPAKLSAWPEGAPRDRLGFATWLIDRKNPLTARVAANRLWQMLFGVGLVKTVDDFGAQGEWPSHPELLDWLALEFSGGGWDTKALLKTIMSSATYRQSSRISPDQFARDPENRLLARGPRQRLAAEMVRDQALAASGLLVEKIGGPSVKPHQPEGLWKDLTGLEDYTPDSGESLYRRGLYTYWKRTVAPPSMIAFDAAGRETCVVRESRTNTPLQALTLLNDLTFVEASLALARRGIREGGETSEGRLQRAFRLTLGRTPRERELALLLESLRSQRERFEGNRQAALDLTKLAPAPGDASLDPVEWAAYATVASLLLNLDETITKQ